MKILISEDQVKTVLVPFFKNENKNKEIISELQSRWNDLDREQRLIVLEVYRTFHPEKLKQLQEQEEKGFWTKFADYGQLGLDIAGVFDPTGIADTVNAVWYFARGEVLFGILSLVSVVPYVGDAIGKPLMILGKAAGKEFKVVSKALETKNAAKLAGAVNYVKGSAFGKKMSDLLLKFADGSLGKKIMGYVKNATHIPIVGKFFKAIEGWVNVFEAAGKQIKIPTKGGFVTASGLKGPEKVDWAGVFKQMKSPAKRRAFFGMGSLKNVDDFKVFRELSKVGKKPDWALKSLFKNIVRVPETRKLMGNSKLFLRFLDKVNLGNFIGPDEELFSKLNQIPNVDQKFADFANSTEGQELFDKEIGSSINASFIETPYMDAFSQQYGLA